jgi:arylsulfatase A-like enzyme
MPNGYYSPYSFKDGTIFCNRSGEYLVDALTDKVIEYIDSHRDKPFFASVAQFGVHPPFQAPSEQAILHFAGKKDPTGVHENPIMAAMIKSVDESVGRIVRELERLGISDNTLFLFVSDNGGNTHMTYNRFTYARAHLPNDTEVPEWLQTLRRHVGDFIPPTNNFPLKGSKGTLYEGGLRVPFIAVWPGKIRPGTVSKQLMSTVDIFPTIMDILSDYDDVSSMSTSRYLKDRTGNVIFEDCCFLCKNILCGRWECVIQIISCRRDGVF